MHVAAAFALLTLLTATAATADPAGTHEAAHPGSMAPFTARGNEPGWLLEIRDDRLRLTLDYGARKIEAALPEPRVSDGTTLYTLDEQGIRIAITDTLCRDDMTGMPHPKAVRVETPDQVLQGCGGAPRSLLEGPEWHIQAVGGAQPPEDVQATLSFLEEDRIAGTGGCNRFMGGYSLSGEGLAIGEIGSTMMACPEPQMAFEQRFLALLETVARFDITPEGNLVLVTRDGQEIRAQR